MLHPLLCEQMAEANRKKVKDFAPELVARNYLQLLKTIGC
jgi:hypothetical protein